MQQFFWIFFFEYITTTLNQLSQFQTDDAGEAASVSCVEKLEDSALLFSSHRCLVFRIRSSCWSSVDAGLEELEIEFCYRVVKIFQVEVLRIKKIIREHQDIVAYFNCKISLSDQKRSLNFTLVPFMSKQTNKKLFNLTFFLHFSCAIFFKHPGGPK